MRKTKRIALLLVALLCSSLSALRAQTFTIEVTDVVTNTWAAKEGSCSLSEVAEALGFSSADALAAELESSRTAVLNGNSPSLVITAVNTSGETTSDYSANYDGYTYGCFWRTAEGAATTWGNNCVVWTCIKWDLDNNQLIGGMGQYPNTCSVGTTYRTTTTLTYGDNSVDIVIVMTIEETPEEDGPFYKELEIVGEETKTYTQDAHPNGLWDSEEFSFDAARAIELLGMTKDEFAEQFETMIWVYKLNSGTQYLDDQLTQKSTANPIGWWFTPWIDEDENPGVCYACDYGKDDAFFTEYFQFNDSAMTITGNIGQSYSGFKGGEERYTEVFLVNGTKAYKLILKLKINEVKTYDFSEMTCVGTEDHNFVQAVRGDYTPDVDSLLIDSICELLGCDRSKVSFKCLEDESTLSNNYTANAPGFWIDDAGKVVEYGSNHKFFIEYDATNGAIRVGQNPGQLTEGQTYKGVFVLCYEDKYYRLNVTLDVPERDRKNWSEFKNVANYELEVQIKPNSTDWNTDTYTDEIDTDALAELLGNPLNTLYGELPDSIAGDSLYTMNYTCTPYPGFWFADDGKVAKYSASSTRIALTFKGNKWEVIQNPGKNQEGQEYHIRQYLVADGTGNMATYDIYITFVDQIVKATDVGEESTTVNLGDGEEEVYQDIDLTQMLEALGCTEEKLVESGIIQTLISAQRYGGSNYSDEAEGFWYDANGIVLNVDDASEIEKQEFCLKFVPSSESDTGKPQLRAFALDMPADGEAYTTKLAFIYNNKRYVMTVSLVNENTYVGIDRVDAETAGEKAIYDLSGRRVNRTAGQLQRGIYVVDGQKVLVK